MKITVIMSALLVSAFCFASDNEIPDFEMSEHFAKAKQASLEQAESAEAQEYFGEMAEFWQKALNKSASNCDVATGSGVELVLKINDQGGGEEVVGSPWNKKSKCYAKIVSQQKAPPPPVHPFYLSSVLP